MWERPPSMPPVSCQRHAVSQMEAEGTLCCPLPLKVSCWSRWHPSTQWGVQWHRPHQRSGLARWQLLDIRHASEWMWCDLQSGHRAEMIVTSEDISKAQGLYILQLSIEKLRGPDHSPLEAVGQAKSAELANSLSKSCRSNRGNRMLQPRRPSSAVRELETREDLCSSWGESCLQTSKHSCLWG